MKKSFCLWSVVLSMFFQVYADEVEDHYKKPLDDIKRDLEAKRVSVKSITFENKTRFLGTGGYLTTAWMAIEVDGMHKRIMLPMVLAIQDKVIDHKAWLEIFNARWNQQIMNISLGLPPGFQTAESILANMDKETKGMLKHLEAVQLFLKTPQVEKGQYLKSLKDAVESHLKKQLKFHRTVEYVDQDGVKKSVILWAADTAVTELKFVRDHITLIEEVLRHHERALALLERERESSAKDLTVQAGEEKATTYEEKKNQHNNEKARYERLLRTLNTLLTLHTQLEGKQTVGAYEDNLLREQIETLKDIQKSLEHAIRLKEYKPKNPLGPYSHQASFFRSAILLCERSLDRLASLGIEMGTRSMLIEVNAEIIEAQEKIKAYKELAPDQKTTRHLADIHDLTQGLALKVGRGLHQLEMEHARLLELKANGQITEHQLRKLGAITIEIETVATQVKEAQKLAAQGRFLMKNR